MNPSSATILRLPVTVGGSGLNNILAIEEEEEDQRQLKTSPKKKVKERQEKKIHQEFSKRKIRFRQPKKSWNQINPADQTGLAELRKERKEGSLTQPG